jgi:hypothetical protein
MGSFIHSSMALQPFVGPWPLLQFRNLFYTDGRSLWEGDQPVARPLPKHRTTQTQNKRIHTPNIHALSGIRTHDPSVRASKDSSCLRPRGYCDRHNVCSLVINIKGVKPRKMIRSGHVARVIDIRNSYKTFYFEPEGKSCVNWTVNTT